MADVFISYARATESLARRVAEALIAEGYDVWWDSKLLPHTSFGPSIEAEIRGAKAVLVIWSQAAAASEWVRAEADLARKLGHLIQIRVDQTEIPLPFNQHQTADLSAWRGDPANPQWRSVLASIAELAARDSALASAASMRPVAKRSRRRLVWAGGALALAAVTVGGLWIGRDVWAPQPSATKIAVQPFETIGAAVNLHELAAGLTDGLQSALSDAKLPMVSQSDSASLAGGDVQSKLDALGVRMLFTGTVEAQGQNVVARVHLEDREAHTDLWSAEYNGTVNAPRPLQAQVGARTTSVLGCAAKGLQSPAGVLSSAQLALFLHACDLAETSGHGLDSPQAAYAMLDAFRQVTRQAPNFADAHAQLAKHLGFASSFLTADQQRGLRDEANREAHIALKLDPRSTDAYVALGLIAPTRQFTDREALFNKALAQDPDWPHANGFLGNTLSDVGRLDDAVAHYQRAAAVNPDSLDWGDIAAFGEAWIGRTDEAEAAVTRLSEDWPKDDVLWDLKLGVLSDQARWADLLAELSHAHDHPGAISAKELPLLKATYAAMRSGALADRAKAKALNLSLSADPGLAQRIIGDLALMGFVDDAFNQAERYAKSPAALDDGPAFLFAPETGALRRDRRFMPLAAEFGLVRYWRTTNKWPDFCGEPGLPYDCKVEAARAEAPQRS